ncbi:ammonium transporter isoform X2 [Calliopsis andreniformis]|uniref:ammonium transporter isoform X2 n=1 Tax=Calliopsis andreniformis TaxID=337506 RepID=UPI003FCE45FE
MDVESNGTNITNSSTEYGYITSIFNLNQEDSNWIVTNSFIIFTMQTGFGMLESGCVSLKNEVNIMMKNVVDIVLGGLTYWAFGFGMSFGSSRFSNPFIGLGEFLTDPSVNDKLLGPKCAAFIFQLSFATTSTTIVSGAMAERCNFKAYCLFSFLNTIVYCIPAGWVWGDHGFLKKLGAIDIAGSGVVHIVGGGSALACAIMLGPRLGRYDNGIDPLPLGNPVNAIMGLFVLWWGWLAFNSGSTYGISGQRWQYAARAAVSTMLASMGGGLIGLGFSLTNSNGIDILSQINGILGALVAITGGCFLFKAWEAIVVGMVGAFVTCFAMPMLDKLQIDDPVGASATHASGIWGIIAIGIFADDPHPLTTTSGRKGLIKGGGWYLLGVQCLTVVCLTLWSFCTSIILLWFVNKIIPIRMSISDELLGADLVEHRIRHMQVGVSRAMSALRPILQEHELGNVHPVGINPGHNTFLEKYNRQSRLKLKKQLYFRRKSVRTPQTNTITDSTLNKETKPNFAWMD